MAILLTIAKWIVGVVMGLVLLLGTIDFFSIGFVSNILPTGVDDLVWTNITLKEVTSAPTGLILKANEYPTAFVITLIPPPADIGNQIKAGDEVAVRIKKESVSHLQGLKVAPTYGLQLKNGQQLFDNTKLITPMPEASQEPVKKLFGNMIAIPILYFLAVIFGPMIYRKFKHQRP